MPVDHHLASLNLGEGLTQESLTRLGLLIRATADISNEFTLPNADPSEKQREELISIGNAFAEWSKGVVEVSQAVKLAGMINVNLS